MRLLLSIVALILTLFGCSGQSSKPSCRVGVDPYWYPLQFGTRDNNVTAFSTELLTEIGKLEKIPFVKVTVNSSNLLDGLQNGQYEAILSSKTPYIFNRGLYDFSDVYLPLGPVLVVPIDSKIRSLDQLSGKEIAVVTGTSYDLILEKSPGVMIRYYDSIPQALNAILQSDVDGAMVDILSATAYCRDLYQGQLKIATPPLNDDGLRLITKHKAAPHLIKGFNEGLKRMQKNGSYKKLLDRWNLQES